jgi:hypothetical protein
MHDIHKHFDFDIYEFIRRRVALVALSTSA